MNTARRPGKLVFVALGQEFRSDDGLGLVVGRALEKSLLHSEIRTCCTVCYLSGDVSGVLDLWAGQDAVVIDAIDDRQAHSGQLIAREVVEAGRLLPDFLEWQKVTRTSTHGLDLSEALQLSELLGKMPDRLRIVGAIGHSFEHGVGLSEPVKNSVPALLDVCTAWAQDQKQNEKATAIGAKKKKQEASHA